MGLVTLQDDQTAVIGQNELRRGS